MRILHVSQPTDGGTARVAATLVSAAVRAGHTVSVACPAGDLAEATRAAGATWTPLELRRSPHPSDLRHIGRLRRLIRDVDVVHLHSSKAGAVGRAALALTPPRHRPGSQFTPHGWSWYVGGRLAPAYRAWERQAARYANVISVVSAGELEDGRRVLRLSDTRRLVEIPNGVDDTEFTPFGAVASRSSQPLILCVGRLARQKGQDVLIRALAKCSHDHATLRFVGEGPDRAALGALTKELGLGERVEFFGSAAPAAHYRAADVVVIPSRWEGHPLVLLEAMASGTAVIASPAAIGHSTPGPPVVAAGLDPTSLATAIDRLISDTDFCAELGRKGRQFVQDQWSMALSVERHMAVLEELVATPRTRIGARAV
jgi:glycosyltransferase involved in cell wall biosynthesis